MRTYPAHLNLLCCLILWFGQTAGSGQQHQHNPRPITPPRVFLDKKPRIVWYQLDRLSNERLLLVKRETTDPKYAPVYMAILTRGGMSRQFREEALASLTRLRKSDPATQLLTALNRLDKKEDRQQQRTSRQLSSLLLARPAAELAGKQEALRAATQSPNPRLRAVGYAALLSAGQPAAAQQLATTSPTATIDWLSGIQLIPQETLRQNQRPAITQLLDPAQPPGVRRAAITTLSSVPPLTTETFRLLAPFVDDPAFRRETVHTLLQVPTGQCPQTLAKALLKSLVRYAESTPVEERTSDVFLEAMQFADRLLIRLPRDAAKAMRHRLRETSVRVVLIHTVEEEMRYDVSYFAVEAGRPVQIVLDNQDLMPHNLVITANGALKEVAQLGLIQGPAPGFQGKPYVPQSPKVLFATGMVASQQRQRLTFDAPSQPGEYPFVCTFPRHWMRMYGVMVVVEDLDDWLANPQKPQDPVGNNRSFVKSWKLSDFENDLAGPRRPTTGRIGQRLLQDATCIQCHKANGQGGAVGPELAGVFDRWKGDRRGVLREILEPSHRVDAKYAMHVVVTTEGTVVTGILTSSDKQSVSLLVNPEAPAPTVIAREDIDEMVKTSRSMMPKALLDRFTRQEILELLSYLESLPAKTP
ncbi:MAG: c-type cytochrome [Planctomycetota bacterium]|nr:c-type cytochrome [Planctomycetota bacterium]